MIPSDLIYVKHYIMLFVFKQKEILKKLKEQINESLNQLDDLIEELPARKEPYTVEEKEVKKKIKIEVQKKFYNESISRESLKYFRIFEWILTQMNFGRFLEIGVTNKNNHETAVYLQDVFLQLYSLFPVHYDQFNKDDHFYLDPFENYWV